MTLICMKMKLHAELIFRWKVCTLTRFETETEENSEMANNSWLSLSRIQYEGFMKRVKALRNFRTRKGFSKVK